MAEKALQAVFKECSSLMVREAYHAAIDEIGKFSAAAAGLLEEAEADALAYLGFPLNTGVVFVRTMPKSVPAEKSSAAAVWYRCFRR